MRADIPDDMIEGKGTVTVTVLSVSFAIYTRPGVQSVPKTTSSGYEGVRLIPAILIHKPSNTKRVILCSGKNNGLMNVFLHTIYSPPSIKQLSFKSLKPSILLA